MTDIFQSFPRLKIRKILNLRIVHVIDCLMSLRSRWKVHDLNFHRIPIGPFSFNYPHNTRRQLWGYEKMSKNSKCSKRSMR